MTSPHIILLSVEAKPEKIDALAAALQSVVKPSQAEDTNIEYRLHQNKEKPAQFILYEIWESPEKHQLQFEKTYIQKLVGQLEDLLA